MDPGFRVNQVVRLSGVPYRTLDFWANTGFVVPSIAQATGKGSDRIYSFQDVVAIRVARSLRDAGISLQSLRKVVKHLQQRQGLDSPLSEAYLASDGHDVFEVRGDEISSLLRRPGQISFAWILDLAEVVEEVRSQMVA
jgi:DNA-binding transcriptional MerR regulator